MKGNDFVFDYAKVFFYKCHKVRLNHSEFQIDSPGWLQKKMASINPKNSNDNCEFQVIDNGCFEQWKN